ncbi:MAG: NAD(P)/FAD-dependent oxidoreductase, partial [Acidobacteriota bacterium]|nr:NAD(P)/FAD-dependent oxidoreductase [Acidobacteriota bacterium]
SVFSYVVSLFRPHIIRELRLAEHGMQLIPLDCSFLPLPNGDSLARWGDAERSRREVARFSRKDSEAYPEFGLAMTKMAGFVKHIIDNPAPDPASMNIRELWKILGMGTRFRDLGNDDAYLHMKLLTMSAADFLDLWFENETLKSPMSVSGIIGTMLGIRSPGTAYVLLHHYMGEIDGAFRSWGFSKGGTGGTSLAIARSAEAFGAEIRTEAPVARVRIQNGRATGVVLQNGDEISAKNVLSNLDPHNTFLNAVGEEHLDDDFLKQIKRFKNRGSSGKVNLALDTFPNFTCRPGDGPHIRGDIAIAPNMDYLERAYDDAKYGSFSKRPYINAVIPSLSDPSVAPPGKHILSCFVQYAPYHLADGPESWPQHREAFGEAVIDTLAEYVPNIRDIILYKQVISPWDIQDITGITEGNIFHGELSLDQLLFMRPTSGWARYKTPVHKLWLCGSGAHPGGGIMGSPGELCAKTMLQAGEV